jgi:hypothetical protein
MVRTIKMVKRAVLLQPVWLLLLATPVLAQSDDPIGPATFVGSFTLWIAIVIGFIASLATLFYAYQLKGGLVAVTLNLLGAGMFFVVLGFLTVAVAWATPPIQKIVHDLLFIIGYILMLLGVLRLRRLT